MAKIVSGHFESDGNAINLKLGFVPDWCILFNNTGQTAPDIYFWFKRFVDDASMYGLLITGSSGVVSRVTTAAEGIDAFDSEVYRVLLPDPITNENVPINASAYNTATTYSARGTTCGQVVRPTTRNGFVYELYTASGGAAGTEPTWGTTVGGLTTAGSGDVWICREENVVVSGGKGVTVGATLQTDARELFYLAGESEKDEDKGDAGRVGLGSVI